MKRTIFLTILSTALLTVGCNRWNPGTTTFQKMYGGSQDKYGGHIQQTKDGGYIVAGKSASTDISGATNHGEGDVYVIKLDGNGNL